MKKKVLVFPCGSEIGLETHRSLRYATHFELIGASSTRDHGSFVYERYVDGLPFVDADHFVDAVNRIVDEWQIDFIIPAHDDVIVRLAQAREAGALRCGLITSSTETCLLTRSKRATYEHFSGIIRVPAVYASPTNASYPAFLKPDVGQGSKGTRKVISSAEAELFLEMDQGLLLLEYLPGREYTIDCFTDRSRSLLFCEGRERARVSSGISVSSHRIEDPRFSELAERINSTLTLRGAWFFQVKEDASGDLALLEIAPRIAGTMGLSRCLGANLPLLSLFDAMEIDVAVAENTYDLTIDRALQNRYRHDIEYSTVYMDFDDTVICDGNVNLTVVAFVFQCINRGIPVHLLTRHANELSETLAKHRLSGLFDSLIWLRNGEDKADAICTSDTILIDDSFAEREKVRTKCGIPVFDVHMVEALLERI